MKTIAIFLLSGGRAIGIIYALLSRRSAPVLQKSVHQPMPMNRIMHFEERS
jgi:hypothetical protein